MPWPSFEDGVRDPLLRKVDVDNVHETRELTDAGGPIELYYAPGTVVEVLVSRGGVIGPARRIVVGEVSPQEVTLR